jgi:hypothetical protein
MAALRPHERPTTRAAPHALAALPNRYAAHTKRKLAVNIPPYLRSRVAHRDNNAMWRRCHGFAIPAQSRQLLPV